MSTADPEPTFGFLQSGRYARLALCETEFHKAAIGDLTHPAMSDTSGKAPEAVVETFVAYALGLFRNIVY